MNMIVEKIKQKVIKELPFEDVGAWVFGSPNPAAWVCPFHDDHKPGSFKINRRANGFKCFSCGESGNSIKLVMKVENCSFLTALAKIADHFTDICTPEELNELKEFARYKENDKNKSSFQRRDARAYKGAPVKPLEFIDMVYRMLPLGKVSEEHRKYLAGRHITEADIRRNGYFTFPGREILPVLSQKLRERGFSENDLVGVPGFYRFKTGKIDMVAPEGIGIPIRNVEGKIVGIQIRRDTADSGSRYTWFSSTFMYANPKAMELMEGGTSPSSPIDVVYPLKSMNRDFIVITEGHFKAARFADRYGCTVLSLQGVGNFRGIEDVIEKLKPKRVMIGFDADMCTNCQVFRNALKLSSAISRLTSVGFLLWDVKAGKGLDDVIDAGNEKAFFGMSLKRYTIFYDRFMKDVKEKCNLPSASQKQFVKVPKDRLAEIYAEDMRQEKARHQA